MKTKLLAIILFSAFVHAQVGINTATPTSTLSVNGSYAGNFRNVSSDRTLDESDQFINVTGNTVVTITLPDTNVTPAITGRVYTIKNTSSQNVIIKGFTDNERLRTVNGSSFTNITVGAGTTVQVVRNQNTTAANRWEVILQSTISISNTEPTRTLTFVRSISSPINANTPNNSVATIGNLRVRYNGTSPNNAGFIEYAVRQASHVTIWYKKAGSGGTGLDLWSTRSAPTGFWYRLTTANPGDQNSFNINPGNRDVSETIIILHNTREVYRITSNLNGAIAADGNVPAVASSVTLFVEKLD